MPKIVEFCRFSIILLVSLRILNLMLSQKVKNSLSLEDDPCTHLTQVYCNYQLFRQHFLNRRISNKECRMSKGHLRNSAVPCSIFDIQYFKILKKARLIFMK
jgi:hypothetical protein